MKKGLFIGIIGAASIALIAIFVTVIMRNGTEKESTRQIKVIDCSGACEVTRDGKTIAVEKDMDLVSNDVFKVSDDGFARIRLDDDKFLYLDRGTVIDITASGDADNSITAIFVHHGSMMTEVKNKLSQESAFTVVSANTTMHIKGTKTLTEVVEDAVTGHVQTSNAILEGQVKIKAIKVKSDGTVVSVEKDLGAGEGNAFSSNKEELVSQELMKSIAGNGFESAGLKIDIVTEEEADVVFDVATFEESFLQNIKEVLVRDAQEAAGEEGLSQEEIDNINNTLDSVKEAFEKIETLSKNELEAQLDNSGKTDAKQEEPVKQPREDVAAIVPKDNTTEAAAPRRTDTVNVTPPTNEEEAARKAAAEEAARKAAEEEAARKAAEEEAARQAAAEEAARQAAAEEAARQAAAEEAARQAAEEERRRQEQEAMLVSLSYQGLSKTVTKNGETVNLHLSFWMIDNEGEHEVINYTLPNRLAKGTALPGIEIQGSNPDVIIWVSNENDVDDGFYFTGWYRSEEAANNNRGDDRITTVPNDVTSLILYAGIEEIPYGNGSDPNSAGNGND